MGRPEGVDKFKLVVKSLLKIQITKNLNNENIENDDEIEQKICKLIEEKNEKLKNFKLDDDTNLQYNHFENVGDDIKSDRYYYYDYDKDNKNLKKQEVIVIEHCNWTLFKVKEPDKEFEIKIIFM